MPKARKPKPGQGKPKRQAAAKQGRPAAEGKGADAKDSAPVGVPSAALPSRATSVLATAPPPIGLVNLGHTCYFNAILQVRPQ